jgi:phage gp36-like protein
MAAYAPIILPAGLASVAYQEIIDEITRDDGGTLATEAIDTAIQEAKMFLTRYDLVQIFGDPVANTAATFSDAALTRYIKNMAVWYLLNLANPNINYDDAKARYEQAIDRLKAIQKGTADPRWPENDPTNETAMPSDSIVSFEEKKRNNNGY